VLDGKGAVEYNWNVPANYNQKKHVLCSL
jgi:hypothetical protein